MFYYYSCYFFFLNENNNIVLNRLLLYADAICLVTKGLPFLYKCNDLQDIAFFHIENSWILHSL